MTTTQKEMWTNTIEILNTLPLALIDALYTDDRESLIIEDGKIVDVIENQ